MVPYREDDKLLHRVVAWLLRPTLRAFSMIVYTIVFAACIILGSDVAKTSDLTSQINHANKVLVTYIDQARSSAIHRAQIQCQQVENLKSAQRKLATDQLNQTITLVEHHQFQIPGLSSSKLIALARQGEQNTLHALAPVDCPALATEGPNPPRP